MITRGSVRRKSADVFKKVIELRKGGHSYSEIRKETGVAKSTINNWITFAGLNLSQEHMQIQTKKRLENHEVGVIASKRTRAKQKETDVNNFIMENKRYFNDPFFVAGIMLYQAEGTKVNNNFSNSDFRLISTYVKFLEKYFSLDRNRNMVFRLYIHETRKADLTRIKNFWSKKLRINSNVFRITWKQNVIVKKRSNLDYVGLIGVGARGLKHFAIKILAISSIILTRYSKTQY